MPCKMSMKRNKNKKKRHSSLPGISQTKTEKLKNNKIFKSYGNKEKEEKRIFLTKITKIQTNNNYHTKTISSPIGILRKATARALALRNQFMRSRSNSNFGSFTGKIKIETRGNILVKKFF